MNYTGDEVTINAVSYRKHPVFTNYAVTEDGSNVINLR